MALLISMCLGGCAIANKMHYARAEKLFLEERYGEALEKYQLVPDYLDSSEKILECFNAINYRAAMDLMQRGLYHDASIKFQSLDDYRDSLEKSQECEKLIRYEKAEQLQKSGDLQGAFDVFKELGSFQDSYERAGICKEEIEEKEWALAASADSSDAYLEYLENPAERYADIAKLKLDEALWREAEELGSPDGYKRYIAFAKGGSHAEEAKLKRRKLLEADFITDETGLLIKYVGLGGDAFIPEGVKRIDLIDFYATNDSHRLITSLELPKSLLYISNAFAFNDVFPEVSEIIADPDNEAYASVDGVLFDKNMTSLILYPVGKAEPNYEIPENVRSISCKISSSFLKSVKISSSVVEGLSEHTFEECGSLEEIKVDLSNPVYKDDYGVLYSKEKDLALAFPSGKRGNA
jgi:tetratricopeptide (TPR) repeat protein